MNRTNIINRLSELEKLNVKRSFTKEDGERLEHLKMEYLKDLVKIRDDNNIKSLKMFKKWISENKSKSFNNVFDFAISMHPYYKCSNKTNPKEIDIIAELF